VAADFLVPADLELTVLVALDLEAMAFEVVVLGLALGALGLRAADLELSLFVALGLEAVRLELLGSLLDAFVRHDRLLSARIPVTGLLSHLTCTRREIFPYF